MLTYCVAPDSCSSAASGSTSASAHALSTTTASAAYFMTSSGSRRAAANGQARHVARRGVALEDALGHRAVDDADRVLHEVGRVLGLRIDRRAGLLDGRSQARHRGPVAGAMLDHLTVLLLGRCDVGHV